MTLKIIVFLILPLLSQYLNGQTFAQYKNLITAHEGRRQDVYVDSMGKYSVGIGHQLVNHKFYSQSHYSDREIDSLFEIDLRIALANCKKLYPAFDQIKPAMKPAIKLRLVDFVFNLGYNRAAKFKKFNSAINAGDYTGAAKELRQSIYYKQVNKRAEEFCKVLLN